MLFHFRIQLAHIKKPPVWREFVVPAQFNFQQFHQVVQAGFGWQDAHLFLFSPEGFPSSPWIKIPDEMDAEENVRVLDARKTKLKDIFPANQKYTYVYDFGDNWKHSIKLLRISDGTYKQAMLTCGKGACPPEDSGGPLGYEQFKQTLSSPGHPEYQELRDWMGLEASEKWNPDFFDLKGAQEAVKSACKM